MVMYECWWLDWRRRWRQVEVAGPGWLAGVLGNTFGEGGHVLDPLAGRPFGIGGRGMDRPGVMPWGNNQ